RDWFAHGTKADFATRQGRGHVEVVIVYAVAERFGIRSSATCSRVFVFRDDQRSAAFAHDKSIAQQVEWTTSQRWIARPSAHRLNNVECADGNCGQWRFGTPRDDHIRKIVSNVTERFANGHGATGATF